jgi:bacillolysin/neutral peptidase B
MPHEIAVNNLGADRTINFEYDNSGVQKKLYDRVRNIETYTFLNLSTNDDSLMPGQDITLDVNSQESWDQPGVSNQANLSGIADFVERELQRNAIADSDSLPYISTVNYGYAQILEECCWYSVQRGSNQRSQMVFGQKQLSNNNTIVSFCAYPDIVAHEVFHGVTDYSCALNYQGESGALNESYSDIFAVIYNNFKQPDLQQWNWELGKPFGRDGGAIRDFCAPSRYAQPEHYEDYQDLIHDYGGVHTNSGIHNKAVYNLLTAQDNESNYIFTPREVLQLFYLSLLLELSETSIFADSRRGVINQAKVLFSQDLSLSEKIRAIEQAFDDVGIESS